MVAPLTGVNKKQQDSAWEPKTVRHWCGSELAPYCVSSRPNIKASFSSQPLSGKSNHLSFLGKGSQSCACLQGILEVCVLGMKCSGTRVIYEFRVCFLSGHPTNHMEMAYSRGVLTNIPCALGLQKSVHFSSGYQRTT